MEYLAGHIWKKPLGQDLVQMRETPKLRFLVDSVGDVDDMFTSGFSQTHYRANSKERS